MPRFLVCTGIYRDENVSKCVKMCPEVKGAIFPYWSIISGDMNYVLHESITCSVKFDIFSKKYAAVQAGMSILG